MNLPLSLILLALALVLLLLYIILHWMSYVAIRPATNDDEKYSPGADAPSFSVVIITHDSDTMLERTIEQVAMQDYPNFEIVVVNNASTDNTSDVIKRAVSKHPGLVRHTYLPQNRNGLLHMSIATTLGARAARNEWIILLKPTSTPKSKRWLTAFAKTIEEGHTLCMGYNDYYGYDNSAWVRQAIRWRRKAQILNYRAVNRGKRKPIEAESSNIAFRKDDFFNNKGYGLWLSVKSFHESLYATTFAEPGQTAFLTTADAQVETILPPIEPLWKTDSDLMRKAQRKMKAGTKIRRRHYTILTLVYLLSVLILAAGIGCYIAPSPSDTTKQILDLGMLPPPLDDIPALPAVAMLVFLIVSLIHLIAILYHNRRDVRNLYVPLQNNPDVMLDE